jgi:hypothetical protein
MQQFNAPHPTMKDIDQLEPLSFGEEIEPEAAGIGGEAEAVESSKLDIGSLPTAPEAGYPAQVDVWEHAVTSLGRENSIECLSVVDDIEQEAADDDALI